MEEEEEYYKGYLFIFFNPAKTMEGVGKEKSDGGAGRTIVPESVIEAVKRTSNNLEEVGLYFDDFLSLCDNDVLSQMDPLQRAQSFLLLAKITTTLFTCMSRKGFFFVGFL